MRWFRRKAASAPSETKSASYVFALGSARVMNQNYLAFASEGYSLNAVAKACIDKITSALASVDLQVYKQDKKGNRRKLDTHPLLTLMNRPNPAMSGRQFLRGLGGNYLIGGNAFVVSPTVDPIRPQPPREMMLLPPEKVTVQPGKTILFPDRYEYRDQNGGMETYAVNQLTGMSPVLHFKTFNPLDPWRGLSPMVAAAFGIDVFNAGQKWNLSLLQSGARPTGALVVKNADGTSQTLSDDQYARLKTQIDDQMSGAANAGKPLLLEGGLEWQEMSINPKDMDFRESMLTMARFVAAVFGVPPQLVNIPGESTYANWEQARTALWTDTVLPLLCTILEDFNRWFAPMFGEDVYVWYDEEMIPALEPIRKAKAERINAAEYLTIDEKREAMGYESYKPTGTPGGTLLVASSDIPLELAGDLGAAEVGSPADNGKKPKEEDDEE
jgi:HK97 family phage portal protein